MVDWEPLTGTMHALQEDVSNTTLSTDVEPPDYDTPFDSSGLGELLNVLDLYYIPILITVGLIGNGFFIFMKLF